MNCWECCQRTSRYCLIVLNALMTLFGLTLIGLTLWVRYDESFEKEMRVNIENMTPNPPEMHQVKKFIREAMVVVVWVAIGWSVALVLLGLWGLLCSMALRRPMTVSYSVLMIILVLLEIAVGVFVIIFRSNVRETIREYVRLSFNFNTIDATSLINRFECCGDDTGMPYNQQRCQTIPRSFARQDCSQASWASVDLVLMVAGLVLLGLVLLQGIAILLSVCIRSMRKRR